MTYSKRRAVKGDRMEETAKESGIIEQAQANARDSM
jgi:hypothetical protein